VKRRLVGEVLWFGLSVAIGAAIAAVVSLYPRASAGRLSFVPSGSTNEPSAKAVAMWSENGAGGGKRGVIGAVTAKVGLPAEARK
jgi:hypothetical protein